MDFAQNLELVIVFLYDCDLCKSEEDDPQEAIIYFYPAWVSGEQRHALCSQLMGITHFCDSSFTAPSVIALQSGKFAIHKTGRFALCVGTDRNIPDVLLRERLFKLHDILRLFHCSIDFLDESSTDDDDDLSDKFSHLLQTYLPIVLDGANSFENIPIYKIPKKSTNDILASAKKVLRSLLTIDGVLGGASFHQNKVIYTQLSQVLTKRIVLAHPCKTKLPAYNVSTPFHLPNGVQLLTVFVEKEEVSRLRALGANIKLYAGAEESQPSTSSYVKGRNEEVLVNSKNEQPTVPDLVLDAVRARQLARTGRLNRAKTPTPQTPKKGVSRTTDDILTTNNISMRYFSLGLPKVHSTWTDRKHRLSQLHRCHFNTICDPQYPLFKPDGLPASSTFYTEAVDGLHKPSVETGSNNNKAEEGRGKSPKRSARQLSLSLSKYSDRPPPKDTPLTPLMAKLSLSVACEETFVDGPQPEPPNKTMPRSTSRVFNSAPSEGTGFNRNDKTSSMTQLVMFVHNFNSSSLVVLLDRDFAENYESIHSLWGTVDEYLTEVDNLLSDESESSEYEVSSAGEYSYAIVDADWGPAERRGFHQPKQLEMLTVFNDTLSSLPQVTDLLVREENSVTYGYRCGTSKIFYQQNCTDNLGVPSPADLMGVIPLKATSVLTRDHDVALS